MENRKTTIFTRELNAIADGWIGLFVMLFIIGLVIFGGAWLGVKVFDKAGQFEAVDQ